MKIPLLLAAAQFAPRIFQVRRRVWIAAGAGLLVLFGLLIWLALTLIGWFFGQLQGWTAAAPEAARGVLEQVEATVPGAHEKLREHLGEQVPALKPVAPPQRDVSGTDLGPVPRYPGMSRTFWHREGKVVTLEYEGAVDYVTVLDHYLKGFAAQGYTQVPQSASPSGETHEYSKGRERILVKVARKPEGGVSVQLDISLQ
jgi:hypothetical protein